MGLDDHYSKGQPITFDLILFYWCVTKVSKSGKITF